MELKQVYREILDEAKRKKVTDLDKFNSLKMRILSKHKIRAIPKNAAIASIASKSEKEEFSGILSMKPTRTISGVSPIALMTDPYPCPHTIKGIGPCTYCPGGPGSPFGDVPQSYTGKEPSTRRSIRNKYDPYLGVMNRIEQYIAMGQVPEKVEIILQGGTFNFFPWNYQQYFAKYLFKAMNDFSILFYHENETDFEKFNAFFELPANLDDKERTERIQERLWLLKNLDLTDKDVLEATDNVFFNGKNSMKKEKTMDKTEKIKSKNAESDEKIHELIGKETIKKIKSIKNKKIREIFLKRIEGIREIKDFENHSTNETISISKGIAKIRSNENGKTTENKENIRNKADSNIAAMKRVLNKIKIHNSDSVSLEKEQERNETARIRCVGLTIETKSDYARLLQGNQMLSLGATRVEMGIQSIYDKVLKLTDRGNTVKDNVEAIRILKDLGFKINLHHMPGLPYTTKDMDKNNLKALFEDEDYRPDMLKLYPCMVMEGTKLYEDYKAGKFKPLSTKEAAELIAWFKQFVPPYCRIMRVQSDIPTNMTESGVDRTNLRQYIEKEMKRRNIKCHCIRCREVGHKLHINPKLKLNEPKIITYEYKASKGMEFFISMEDAGNDALFGFCRMRIPHESLRKEITEKSVLIRELHVFGSAVSIGKKGKIQHTGIGKRLLKEAEEIAKGYGFDKAVVISGVGVRDYYRKLGYGREGAYMVKRLV